MVSFLDGPLASALHAGLSPQLPAGKLHSLGGNSTNEFGDPIDTVTKHDFRGFREEFSLFAKSRDGIEETDYMINIIAQSIAVTPTRDDEVLLQGQWSRVRKIASVDPASALYVLQCYEIDAPTT